MKDNLFKTRGRVDGISGSRFSDDAFSVMDENSMHEQEGWTPDGKEPCNASAKKCARTKKSACSVPVPEKKSMCSSKTETKK